MKALAAKALSLRPRDGRSPRALRGTDAGAASQTVAALRGVYRTPWELALQRWLESVAPGERTFARPSRRGAERTDVVLPGRRREGWILNVVLDTSGSMTDEIPRALGAIGEFCDAVGVDQVRLVQCDAAVTADELVAAGGARRAPGRPATAAAISRPRCATSPTTSTCARSSSSPTATSPTRRGPSRTTCCGCCRRAGRPAFGPPYGRVITMQPV